MEEYSNWKWRTLRRRRALIFPIYTITIWLAWSVLIVRCNSRSDDKTAIEYGKKSSFELNPLGINKFLHSDFHCGLLYFFFLFYSSILLLTILSNWGRNFMIHSMQGMRLCLINALSVFFLIIYLHVDLNYLQPFEKVVINVMMSAIEIELCHHVGIPQPMHHIITLLIIISWLCFMVKDEYSFVSIISILLSFLVIIFSMNMQDVEYRNIYNNIRSGQSKNLVGSSALYDVTYLMTEIDNMLQIVKDDIKNFDESFQIDRNKSNTSNTTTTVQKSDSIVNYPTIRQLSLHRCQLLFNSIFSIIIPTELYKSTTNTSSPINTKHLSQNYEKTHHEREQMINCMSFTQNYFNLLESIYGYAAPLFCSITDQDRENLLLIPDGMFDLIFFLLLYSNQKNDSLDNNESTSEERKYNSSEIIHVIFRMIGNSSNDCEMIIFKASRNNQSDSTREVVPGVSSINTTTTFSTVNPTGKNEPSDEKKTPDSTLSNYNPLQDYLSSSCHNGDKILSLLHSLLPDSEKIEQERELFEGSSLHMLADHIASKFLKTPLYSSTTTTTHSNKDGILKTRHRIKLKCQRRQSLNSSTTPTTTTTTHSKLPSIHPDTVSRTRIWLLVSVKEVNENTSIKNDISHFITLKKHFDFLKVPYSSITIDKLTSIKEKYMVIVIHETSLASFFLKLGEENITNLASAFVIISDLSQLSTRSSGEIWPRNSYKVDVVETLLYPFKSPLIILDCVCHVMSLLPPNPLTSDVYASMIYPSKLASTLLQRFTSNPKPPSKIKNRLRYKMTNRWHSLLSRFFIQVIKCVQNFHTVPGSRLGDLKAEIKAKINQCRNRLTLGVNPVVEDGYDMFTGNTLAHPNKDSVLKEKSNSTYTATTNSNNNNVNNNNNNNNINDKSTASANKLRRGSGTGSPIKPNRVLTNNYYNNHITYPDDDVELPMLPSSPSLQPRHRKRLILEEYYSQIKTRLEKELEDGSIIGMRTVIDQYLADHTTTTSLCTCLVNLSDVLSILILSHIDSNKTLRGESQSPSQSEGGDSVGFGEIGNERIDEGGKQRSIDKGIYDETDNLIKILKDMMETVELTLWDVTLDE